MNGWMRPVEKGSSRRKDDPHVFGTARGKRLRALFDQAWGDRYRYWTDLFKQQ